MRLLTHNFLQSNVRGTTKGYPLKIVPSEILVEESPIDTELVRKMLPKLKYSAVLSAVAEISEMANPKPPAIPTGLPEDLDQLEEAQLEALHHVLFCLIRGRRMDLEARQALKMIRKKFTANPPPHPPPPPPPPQRARAVGAARDPTHGRSRENGNSTSRSSIATGSNIGYAERLHGKRVRLSANSGGGDHDHGDGNGSVLSTQASPPNSPCSPKGFCSEPGGGQ